MERYEKLIKQWHEEEKLAMEGWNFAHINDRYTEETDLPWDYEQIIHQFLRNDHRLLDIDTGGGEFLLSLGHPGKLTSATENYEVNIAVCQKRLLPEDIDFKPADPAVYLPFADDHFDIVINRHGDYHEKEIYRVLKKGGYFISEQVGAQNDRDLIAKLYKEIPPVAFPTQNLTDASQRLQTQGFKIIMQKEAFRPIKFFDVGALVWFAKVLPWEFCNFTVDAHLQELITLQKELEQKGMIEGTIHRYIMVAQKI